MHHIELTFLFIAISLLYIQPTLLKQYINTLLGRVISLIILILASLYSTNAGMLVAMIIVLFSENIFEGMEQLTNQSGINMDNLKKGSVSNDLLDSTTDTNRFGQNDIDITKSGASIIGDTPGEPLGSAVTDLKVSSTSDIMFSPAPSTSEFRKNNCKTVSGTSKKAILDKNGKEMKINDIKKKYPLNFLNGIDCNPCDDNCKYTITDSVDQLYREDTLRSKQSSTMIV